MVRFSKSAKSPPPLGSSCSQSNGGPEDPFAGASGASEFNAPIRPPKTSALLALIGGVVGAVVGGVVSGGVEYITLRYAGIWLIGVSGLIAGFCVGWPMKRFGHTQSPFWGVIGAGLAFAAAFFGFLMYLPLGTGKSLEQLFSPAEREATVNTITGLGPMLSYLLAIVCGYLFSWDRRG